MTADRTDTGDRQGREALRAELRDLAYPKHDFERVEVASTAVPILTLRAVLAALPPSVPDEEPHRVAWQGTGSDTGAWARAKVARCSCGWSGNTESEVAAHLAAPSVPGPAPADEDGPWREIEQRGRAQWVRHALPAPSPGGVTDTAPQEPQ